MNRFKTLAPLLLLFACPRAAAELRPITEADFICQGRAGRSLVYRRKEYRDCGGGHLPRGGVHPRLIKLLNRFQKETGKQVVVASGYRCQAHNLYSWAALAKETGNRKGVNPESMHRAGAAADIYFEGTRGFDNYVDLAWGLRLMARKGRPRSRVLTKVYDFDQVRDPDNRHDYPYVHVHLQGVERKAVPPATP